MYYVCIMCMETVVFGRSPIELLWDDLKPGTQHAKAIESDHAKHIRCVLC
jgi:hypothetical protein